MKPVFLLSATLLGLSACAAVEMQTGAVFGAPVTLAASPADAMGLAREGTKLYTGAKSVLRVYETAGDALHPRLLGEVVAPNGATVRQLAVRDGLVGISAREGQVMFFDFTDPTHPRFLSRFDCCELATGIDFGGNVCFCGQRNYGVEFIDVTDPVHPAHIALRKTDESQSVVYRDGYCYSGEWGAGRVSVFDCRDMAKIARTACEELHGVGDGLWLDGHLLLAATGHHAKHRPTAGLRTYEPEDLLAYSGGKKIPGAGAGHGLDLFDAADPAHPKHLARLDYPPFYSRGNDFWTVRASGQNGLVFAAQSYNGLFAVDVSDPASPRVADRLVLPCKTRAGAPSAVIGSVAVGDGVVYVAAHEHGVLAVPARGVRTQTFRRGVAPRHPEFREAYPNDDARFARWLPETRGQVRGVAVKGDLVYAACGDAGLYALRAQGDSLQTIRRVPGIEQAYDVDLKGERLVAAEGRRGWAFYRIGADGVLTEEARIARSPDGRDFGFWTWMLSGRWTVLSPRNGAYLLVDTSAGAQVKALLPVNAPGWSKYLADRLIDGKWLCWNMGNSAAAWVDVTAPTVGRLKMNVIQSTPKYRGGPITGCCALGGRVLFLRRSGAPGYSLYAPGVFADEVFPLKVKGRDFYGIPRTDGRHLLVCNRADRRVAFFDIANPEKAVCLWCADVSGHPDSGVVAGGRAFIPCGHQGLLMSKAADTALRTWADAAWTRVMKTFYSPKTGNIYITRPQDVSPAADFPGGLLKPECGYGRGLEDCAIDGGVALSGLVDQWAVARTPSVPADAEKVARGLLNLATAHPYRGFVARGLCVEDGRSICRLTSRDQVTHWMHGLYRYYDSPLASEAMKRKIRRVFAEVAARMERNVTKANNWNFLQADGTMDPRGICKMRETYPHEAARLAMVYALAWKVTEDARWHARYHEVRDEALTGSCALATCPDRIIRGLMPDYALIQMNTSLEALLAVETDAKCRAEIVRAMVMCANLARERAPKIGNRDTKYLCGCAEVHLAQLMVPKDSFSYAPEQRALLADAITHVPSDRVGACRACHLFAAYWRLMRYERAE